MTWLLANITLETPPEACNRRRKPRGVLRVQCLPANVVLLLEEPAETRDVGAGAGAWLMA
jgi:hypothetical protein